jgi:hypothetical protein
MSIEVNNISKSYAPKALDNTTFCKKRRIVGFLVQTVPENQHYKIYLH